MIDIVLEHLKRIQADLGEVRRDMREVKAEVISLRTIMGEFIKADGRRDGSIATLEHRIARIERHLELQDTIV